MPGSLLRYDAAFVVSGRTWAIFPGTNVEKAVSITAVSLWKEIDRPVLIVYFVDR